MVSRNGPIDKFDPDIFFSDYPNETFEQPRALIVEDETIVAEDLRQKLQNLGYTVVGVTASGREAIEYAKMNAPDIVLMDCRIGSDLNGPEAAVIIQGLLEYPIPIVFLTAYSPSDYPLLRAVEPYLYLRKPFTDVDLERILEKAKRIRIFG
jgi:CheY-like chemotaxis protein